MGWKTLKSKFGIEHIVCVMAEGIYIGSAYVRDLAVVNPQTGQIVQNPTFSGFLAREYPQLAAASPAEVLQALEAPDVFASSTPVYTYEGSQILEKQCEALGWPNVTHDGCLMYENTYFVSKAEAIRQALAVAVADIKSATRNVAHLKAELDASQAYLAQCEQTLEDLRAGYSLKIA